MNMLVLVWNYLKARPLNTVINIVLLALGIAVITVLLLFSTQIQQKVTENSRGIDLVIGAKGSPLQLILCNIFHIDFPTGNIKLSEAERVSRTGLIKRAIPLALGDSYESFRIIGTNRTYADLYNLQIEAGEFWINDLEVSIGSNVHNATGLSAGSKFASAHGLSSDGNAHNDQLYVVKGIFKPTNTIVDNLILTNVESIWKMHEEHAENTIRPTSESSPRSKLVPSAFANDSVKEITSLLVQYRSPLAAIQLPRLVNTNSSLQAASPAFETARLFSILGVGVDIIMSFAYVLIGMAALSIFIALYNSLKERRYDMAIMRSMGASRSKLLLSILLEGGALTLFGSLLGLLTGHTIMVGLSTAVAETRKAGISGFVFYDWEWILLAASLLLGFICAIVPAIQAYRTDLSKVLAGN